MRSRLFLLPVVALVLASCGTSEPAPEPTAAPTATQETTQEAAPAPTVEPTEEPTPECEAGTPDTALAEAIHAATPDGAAVRMIQELESDDGLDVIIHVCTPPVDDFRTLATDLAIAAHDTGESINAMVIYQYNPDGEEGETLEVEDFGQYTWDRDAARAPEKNWS